MTKSTVEDKVFRWLREFGKDDTWDDMCQETLVERLAPLGNPGIDYTDHEIQAYWSGYFDAMVFRMTRLDPRFDKWRESCPK